MSVLFFYACGWQEALAVMDTQTYFSSEGMDENNQVVPTSSFKNTVGFLFIIS